MRIVVLFGFILTIASVNLPAMASTSGGIDTPTGVASMPFAIGGIEVMTLQSDGLHVDNGSLISSGNVAIGTTSAPETLTVAGGWIGLDNGQAIGFKTSGGTYWNALQLDGSNNLWVGSANFTGAIQFYTNGTAPMTITSTGVGIGISNPQAVLDVAGPIRAGSAGIITGGACKPEGAMSYDLTNHRPVYCSQAAAWKGSTPTFLGTVAPKNTYPISDFGATVTTSYNADLCVLSDLPYQGGNTSAKRECTVTGTPGGKWTLVSNAHCCDICAMSCYNF
jgi:hypothetical protein